MQPTLKIIPEGVIPQTLEEGKLYYPHFEQVHLDRKKKFVPETELIENRISFPSFPRCGSNFLRFQLEQIYGFFIGDDRKKEPISEWLWKQGNIMFGYENCWIVKSHLPLANCLRMPGAAYKCRKAFSIVRDPVDTVMSMWQLHMNVSHSARIPHEDYMSSEVFKFNIIDYSKRFAEWHDYWLKQDCSMYWLRYEDVVKDMEKEVRNLISYIEERDITGTETDEKLKVYFGVRSIGASIYRAAPREKEDLYTILPKEILQQMYWIFKDYCQAFGYLKNFREKMQIEDNDPIDEVPKFIKINEKCMKESLEHNLRPIQFIDTSNDPEDIFVKYRANARQLGVQLNEALEKKKLEQQTEKPEEKQQEKPNVNALFNIK